MPRSTPSGESESRMKRRPNRGTLQDRLANLSGETKGPAEPRLIFNAREVLAAIEVMVSEGGALLFGTTSDGGVLTVTTYLGKDKHTNYVGSREQWLELYYSIVDDEVPSELEGEGSE